MSSFPNAVNPLSYLGVTPNKPAPTRLDTRAPTADDVKNFIIGTIWINTDSEDAYILVNNAIGVATWIQIGGTPGEISTITTPDANVVTPVANNINFINGAGMTITGSGDDITFNSAGVPFVINWEVITTATKNIVVNEGYFANRGGGVTFTLPAVADVGEVIFVTTMNAGGFTIAQNAGQNIRLGNSISTTGVGGSLASTDIGDSVTMVCNVANTSFFIINSVGNITVT